MKRKMTLTLVLLAGATLTGCITTAAIVLVGVIAGGGHKVNVHVAAPPERVYAAALNVAGRLQGVEITKKDPKKFTFEAKKGKNSIKGEIKRRKDNSSDLIIVGKAGEKDKKDEHLALDAVTLICNELDVPYRIEKKKK
jgi:hypothetical protein